MEFIPNKKYSELLLQNTSYHLRVRSGKASYLSEEYKELQRQLTDIELNITSKDIIEHAEHLFPKVGP